MNALNPFLISFTYGLHLCPSAINCAMDSHGEADLVQYLCSSALHTCLSVEWFLLERQREVFSFLE